MPGELPTSTLPPTHVIGFAPLMEEEGSTEQNSPTTERPATLLKFHPKRWMVLAGLVVPQVGHLVLGDGIDGVRLMAGRAVIGLAKAKMEQAGWSLIPLSLGPLPDGSGGRTYIREVVPGRYYCSAWEHCPKGEPSLIETDTPAYAAWLRDLVTAGHLPAPTRLQLTRLRQKYREDGSVFAQMARTSPILADDAERCLQAVRVIDAEIERLYGPRGPASAGAALQIDDDELEPAPPAAPTSTPEPARKGKGA